MLHKILRLKMRPRFILAARSVHHTQNPLLPQRQQWSQSRIESKKTIQIHQLAPTQPDRRPRPVITIIPMRHHQMKAIRPAPQKNHNQGRIVIALGRDKSGGGHRRGSRWFQHV